MTTTTWFTSDMHLGHARINDLAGRPFTSVAAADAEIESRWNSVVAPNDIVYVLGDACLGVLAESLAIVRRLNGVKLLVPGNHDRVSSLYKGSDAKKREWRLAYEDAGFRILDEQTTTTIGPNLVDLCHFPYEGDSHGEDRYSEARPVDTGAWLIHGHVHEKWKVRGRQINVGVDVHNFTPVAEEQLVEIIDNSG